MHDEFMPWYGGTAPFWGVSTPYLLNGHYFLTSSLSTSSCFSSSVAYAVTLDALKMTAYF